MSDLNGKTVIVTGAAGALGSAVLAELSARGAKVAAIDMSDRAVEADVAFGGVDITREAAALDAVTRTAAALGPLHGLVNVAGGFVWETVMDGTIETWERMFHINLRTSLSMCRAFVGHAAERASIVNIGAGAARRAQAGMGAYTASKAGLEKLTEALAEEQKDRLIRVNAILPSIIDTPVNRADMPDAAFDRWVTPAQIAKVAAFLLSDDAGAITGALLPVSGRV